MIFPYWQELRGAEQRLLPLIPITVRGPQDIAELLALVDSGAEQCVFPADLATELGIVLGGAEPVTIVGAGEHELPGHLISTELKLCRRVWRAPVIFAEGLIRPVLGQAGFFAFFTVTFRHSRREIEIRWANS